MMFILFHIFYRWGNQGQKELKSENSVVDWSGEIGQMVRVDVLYVEPLGFILSHHMCTIEPQGMPHNPSTTKYCPINKEKQIN